MSLSRTSSSPESRPAGPEGRLGDGVVPAAANAITRRRQGELRLGAVILVGLAIAPLFTADATARNIIILTALYAGLSQAWNILGGYCGQISLGHALYFGIGGYASSLLFVHAGVPPLLGMFLGGLAGAAVALLVGWPCFRLSGHYYAIATVVMGEIGFLVFQNWDLVGGASGIYIPLGPDSWLNMQFRTAKLPFHAIVLGFAAACWCVAWLLEGSRLGYAWRAVKDDPVAARSLGVHIFRSKMAAAAISGGLTGIGGAIYAQVVGNIDPSSILAGEYSILIALPAVLGGAGTLWGPLLGAGLLIPARELTRSYIGGGGSGIDLMFYGGLIVVVALARPNGLVSLFGGRRRPVVDGAA